MQNRPILFTTTIAHTPYNRIFNKQITLINESTILKLLELIMQVYKQDICKKNDYYIFFNLLKSMHCKSGVNIVVLQKLK